MAILLIMHVGKTATSQGIFYNLRCATIFGTKLPHTDIDVDVIVEQLFK